MRSPTIDDAIEETIALMEGARDYVMDSKSYSAEFFGGPLERMAAIRESSRLTGQLTAILSWLLWQKAAVAGEITHAELAERTAELFDTEPPQAAPMQGGEPLKLPDQLVDLVLRADQLFGRISRLHGRQQSPS